MKINSNLFYAAIFVFFVWCLIAFRSDIAQIKFAPVWQSRNSILLALFLSVVNYSLRIFRWSQYLSRMGHSLPVGFTGLTYIAGFAFTLSPGKIGEMMRGRYYQKIGIPLSSTAAAFFIERIMDILAMLVLACLALASISGYETVLVGLVGFIAMIFTVLTMAPWTRISEWLQGKSGFPAILKKPVQGVLRTLLSAKSLLHPQMLLIGFLVSLLAWGAEGTGLMVIGTMFPAVAINWSTATSIYSVSIIAGVLSFLPGGLGSTEAVMVALLAGHGYALPEAMLMTLVCRLLTLWFAVMIGWISVLALKNKPIKAANLDYFYDAEKNHMSPSTLCVDLDGTLIRSDLLLETFLLLLKSNPFYLLLIPVWLLRGKASLKAEIAKRVTFNPEALPYNQDFLCWLDTQKQEGRELWLCTASNYRLADLVAAHLQIFHGVCASSDTLNLSGRNKAKMLITQFGEKGFDYCGNHHIDLNIWQVSAGAVVVNANETLKKKAEQCTEVRVVFPKPRGNLSRSIFKAIRIHQWVKNALVFVPLAAAHKLSDPVAIHDAFLAFIAFGFCASSVYLLNDMLDLEVDRQHPRKRKRPFASGDLSLLVGFALVPILLLGSVLLAANLPKLFWVVLGAYYALTLAYSFGLKRVVLVDTMALAGLYTVRIIAGAVAVDVPLSFWLLLFSIFIFFSLALVKRFAELDTMQRQGKLEAGGRGYHVEDLPILHSLGTASGNLCVLVLALYINSPAVESLYRHPKVIWFLCVLLLYWISRVWLKTHRGEMHDDPVVFALKDKISLVIGFLAVITMMLAI
jgi:uncharacterized protein (TIRG00374 family)